MTYTFKISRRLAASRRLFTGVALAAVFLACAPGEAIEEGLAPPEPSEVIQVLLNPDSVTVASTATVDFAAQVRLADASVTSAPVSWLATGGNISSSGHYVAGQTPGRFHVIARAENGVEDSSVVLIPQVTVVGVTALPAAATLTAGDVQQFTAATSLSNGSTNNSPTVTWSATGGSINSAGLYTSGASSGSFRVIATVGALADTSAITITAPIVTIASISLTPVNVALSTGQTQQFAVSAQMTDGSTQSNPGVSWSATGGNVSTTGFYAAGNTAGSYRVIATSANGKADTSNVTLTQPVATIASISLTPASVSLLNGATQQFSVSAAMSDGSTQANPGVTWTATGGSVSSSGLYTSGATAGSFRVIATSSNGKADTSDVTLTAPVATVAAIVVTPGSSTLLTGQTQQFSASAQMSDGSTQGSPSVTWAATGGNVSGNGLYTAGGSAGSFRVIATSTNGKADTSAITVTVPAPTISQISVTPASVSLQTGAGQQFSASATMSDGSTQGSPSVTWTATGGSVSSNGLYTAGSSAGSFRVIALSGNGKADTSSVTVTAPTISTVSITPATVSLQVGQTQQFSSTATMSDGSSANPTLTWNATGGTINGSRVFTAGSTAGTFRVIGTSANGKADTSNVTVTAAPPAATISTVSITPASVSLQTGQSQSFSATATMSDGSTSTPSLTWSATGGSMSAGVYTAGATAGSYRVIGTSGNGKADTANVTVTAATGTSEPAPSGNIFFDGRAGGAQSFQSANSLADINNFIKANGGVGLESGWSFTPDYNGSGKKALRIDWHANPGGESGATGTYYYPSTVSRVYCSVVIHLGRTATGGGLGSIGSFAPVSNAGGMKRFMWLRQADNGTDRLYWVWPAGGQPGGQKLSIDNLNYDSSWNTVYPTGVDVRYTFEIISGNPGTLRVWQNGVLVHNNTNAQIGTRGFAESQLSTVRFAGAQDESEYWTDLVFWTP